METEASTQAIAFANWLWLNYICYYSNGRGQWLGHDDTGPLTTEELYKKWSLDFQGNTAVSADRASATY
jgi:hypothetical protein